jgi:hypothetical protein
MAPMQGTDAAQPDPPVETPTLSYNTTAPIRKAPAIFWLLALAGGTIPAAVAVFCLAGYWITESKPLISVGFFDLVYGGIAVVLGLIFAIVYLVLAGRATVNRNQCLNKGIAALGLLLVNFPFAAACVYLGLILVVRAALGVPVTFTVKNISATPIENAKVHLGDDNWTVGPIAPNDAGSIEAKLHTKGAFSLETTINSHHYISLLQQQANASEFARSSVVTIEVDGNGNAVRK